MREAAATFWFAVGMFVTIDQPADNWIVRGVALGVAASAIRAMARQEAR